MGVPITPDRAPTPTSGRVAAAKPPTLSPAKVAFNKAFNAKFNARFNAAHAPKPPARAAAPKAPAYFSPQEVQGAKALANAATQPVINQLASQIAQNGRQTTGAVNQVGGFYNQLGQQAQQGVTAEGNIGSALNQQLASIGQGQQSALQGIGQNALSSLAKYAPQDDQSNSLAAPAASALTSEIARQQGLAAQQQGAFQAFGANQGANYQGMAASNLGTFAKAGQQSLGSIAQAGQVRNAPLESKIASEQGLYGTDYNTALGKLHQQDITNQISQAGLGIKQQTANAATANANTNATNAKTKAQALAVTAQNDRANQSLKAFQINSTNSHNAASLAEKTAYDNANVAIRQMANNIKAAASGSKTGIKPLTTYQQDGVWRSINEAATLIQAAQKAGHNGAQIRQALGTGSVQKGFPAQPPQVIDAAWALLGYGGKITPQIQKELQNAGVTTLGSYNGSPVGILQQRVLSPTQAATGVLNFGL